MHACTHACTHANTHLHLGCTPRGLCDNTFLRRALRRFSRVLSRRFSRVLSRRFSRVLSRRLLEGFLEGVLRWDFERTLRGQKHALSESMIPLGTRCHQKDGHITSAHCRQDLPVKNWFCGFRHITSTWYIKTKQYYSADVPMECLQKKRKQW